jgi:hypothetical protein
VRDIRAFKVQAEVLCQKAGDFGSLYI